MGIVQLELGSESIGTLDFADNAIAETEIDALEPATGIRTLAKDERVMLLKVRCRNQRRFLDHPVVVGWVIEAPINVIEFARIHGKNDLNDLTWMS
jgi:hypothetical protein